MAQRKAAIAIFELDANGDPAVLSEFKHTLEDRRAWTVYPFKRKDGHPSVSLIEVVTLQKRGIGAYVIAGVPDYARPVARLARRLFTIREIKESDHPVAAAIRQAWKAKLGDGTGYTLKRSVSGLRVDDELSREDWGNDDR